MAEEEVFVEEKAAIVDPGHSLKRIGGIPSPLFGASASIPLEDPVGIEHLRSPERAWRAWPRLSPP